MLLTSLLFVTVAPQLAAPQEATQFLERLIACEVSLQLDRRDVKSSKDNKAALNTLMTDAASTRATIQTFQDTHLASLADDAPKKLLDFRDKLEAFKTSLDASQILSFRLAGNGTQASTCCDHDNAYMKFMISALSTPGISLQTISVPSQYNLWPVLYEKNHGLIYADPSAPDKAQILPRIVRRGSLLRKGDVIVALRPDKEEKWEEIETWKDVLHESKDFERGEHEVFLQIKRGKAIKELRMMASTVIVNTE